MTAKGTVGIFFQEGNAMGVARIAVLLAISFVAIPAWSQTEMPVGILLDKGGKKLSSEEVKALLTGATVDAERGGNVHTKTTYRPDGSLSAHLQTMDFSTGGAGSWKVEDNGSFCISINWTSQFPPVAGCSYVLKLGNSYFFSVSDSVRHARAVERLVTR
jgi:hypothetical protein